MKLIYRPDIFDAHNEFDAKKIILTPKGSTSKQRWKRETPFLVDDICSFAALDEHSLVLDFGCGIGRVSKALIRRTGCGVLGFDIRQSMRELAVKYVASRRFSATGRILLANLIERGVKVDLCVAVWVLQHCPKVEEELALINSVLKDDGFLYVLNYKQAAIPTNIGWVNDGSDIRSILESRFDLVEYSHLPKDPANRKLSNDSFIAKLRKSAR